jgi:hypothetical protein
MKQMFIEQILQKKAAQALKVTRDIEKEGIDLMN